MTPLLGPSAEIDASAGDEHVVDEAVENGARHHVAPTDLESRERPVPQVPVQRRLVEPQDLGGLGRRVEGGPLDGPLVVAH